MKKQHLIGILGVGILLSMSSCKKNTFAATDTLYVPAATDVTATATLAELQSGYTLYKNSCGACHSLYSPDSYSASNWTSILSSMAPKAGLSTADKTLVYKYVTRGK
jgi:cytochrome c5